MQLIRKWLKKKFKISHYFYLSHTPLFTLHLTPNINFINGFVHILPIFSYNNAFGFIHIVIITILQLLLSTYHLSRTKPIGEVRLSNPIGKYNRRKKEEEVTLLNFK